MRINNGKGKKMNIVNHFEVVSVEQYPTLDDVIVAYPGMCISKCKDGWLILGATVED